MTHPPRVVGVWIWVKALPGLISIHIIYLLWLIQTVWAHISSVTKYDIDSIDFIIWLGTAIKEGNLLCKLNQLCCHLIVYLHLIDSNSSTSCTFMFGISPQHLIKLHRLLSCLLSHGAPCCIIDHVLTLGHQSIIENWFCSCKGEWWWEHCINNYLNRSYASLKGSSSIFPKVTIFVRSSVVFWWE